MLTITFNADPHSDRSYKQQLAEAMEAIGFQPVTAPAVRYTAPPVEVTASFGETLSASAGPDDIVELARLIVSDHEVGGEVEAPAQPVGIITDVQVTENSVTATVKPIRERGKPCPLSGRKRRTKEEIAEDEAAERAEVINAAVGTAEILEQGTLAQPTAEEMEEHYDAVNAEIDAQLAEPEAPKSVEYATDIVAALSAPEPMQISTSEERVEPAYTLEDLKTAFTGYAKKYGPAAVQADGQEIFRSVLGAPPEGESHWRMTIVPDAKYGALIDACTVALHSNPYGRERVA